MVQRGHLHAQPQPLAHERGAHQQRGGVRASGDGEQHRAALESEARVRLVERGDEKLCAGASESHLTAAEWNVGYPGW